MARYRSRYVNIEPRGKSSVRPARYDGRCAGCGGSISAGEDVYFYDVPRPRSIYHARCEAPPRPESPPEPETTEPESPPAEEPAPETTEPEADEPRPVYQDDGSIDSIIDRRIKHALGAFKPSEAVNAAQVQALLDQAMDRESIKKLVAELTAPSEVTVKIVFPDGKQVEIKGAHHMLGRVVRLVAGGVHVVLWGPPGTGKTTLAMQVAEALKRKFEVDTLDQSTFKSAILGFQNAAGKPVYVPFLRCYENGLIYIADELDCAPGNVQVLFNTALANGHAPAAWGNLDRAKKFAFIGCMNTPGRPTKDHPERKNMAQAFKDRLYFVYVPQDPNIEARAAGLPCEPIPERVERTCTPAEWVTWVRTVRAWSEQNAVEIHPFTGQRASLNGLTMLGLGESPEEIADGLVFKGADSALREKVLRNCPLP